MPTDERNVDPGVAPAQRPHDVADPNRMAIAVRCQIHGDSSVRLWVHRAGRYSTDDPCLRVRDEHGERRMIEFDCIQSNPCYIRQNHS